MQDCKDGRGLQFIKFDSPLQAVKRLKLTFLWNLDSFSPYFVSFVNISLLLLFIFFLLFQDNKQA